MTSTRRLVSRAYGPGVSGGGGRLPAGSVGKAKFKLSDVDGLVWLPDPDSPDIILNSGEVRTLPDATDPSEDAEQATAANQPTFVESDAAANGRSTVRFVSGNGDFLTAGDNHAPGSGSFSLFVPFRLNSDTLARLAQKQDAGGRGWFFQYNGQNGANESVFRIYFEDDAGNTLLRGDAIAGTSLLDGAVHLGEYHYDSGSGRMRLMVDRVSVDSAARSVFGPNNPTNDLVLGCNFTDATTQDTFFDGWMGKPALYLRSEAQGSVVQDSEGLKAIRDFYTSLYGTP